MSEKFSSGTINLIQINTLQRRLQKGAIENWMVLIHFKLNPHHPRMLCTKILPLKNIGAIYLNKLESSSPKNVLCQVWLKLAPWFLRTRFLNLVNVFWLFHYYLPLEKGGVLHSHKHKSSRPKHALCLVWLKMALWFLRRLIKFVNVFSLFPYCLPLEKGVVLHLNKPESLSPKDALWQVKIG